MLVEIQRPFYWAVTANTSNGQLRPASVNTWATAVEWATIASNGQLRATSGCTLPTKSSEHLCRAILVNTWGTVADASNGQLRMAAPCRLGKVKNFLDSDWIAQRIRECQSLEQVRRLHGEIAGTAAENDRYLGNLLVQIYGKHGSIEDAKRTFDCIARKNVFSWTVLLGVYVHSCLLDQAKTTFDRMPQTNVVSWNSMVAAYGRAGHLLEARLTFDSIPEKDVAAWNSILWVYSQNGEPRRALELFRRMEAQPNRITYLNLIDACSSLSALAEGREFHAAVVEQGWIADSRVSNALIDMYGKAYSIDEAKRVFEAIESKDSISWTALLAAYAKNGRIVDAIETFEQMPTKTLISWNAIVAALSQNGLELEAIRFSRAMDFEGVKPNEISFVTSINACASLGFLAQGRSLHRSAVEAGVDVDPLVGTAIVNMYGKCGRLDDAIEVFRRIERRDVVSWTALIGAHGNCGDLDGARATFRSMPCRNVVSWSGMLAALVDQGSGDEALEVFHKMQLEGLLPDESTFLSALDACAGAASLNEGRTIHSMVVARGLSRDLMLGTAIVGMYGRCGAVDDARLVFERDLTSKDLISWSTMMGVLAQNGLGKEALQLLNRMDFEGFKADEMVLAAAIEGCASIGAIERVLRSSVIAFYGKCGRLDASQEAFAAAATRDAPMFHAMMEAFFHNGLRHEALRLFHAMELEGIRPNAITFLELLNACAHLGVLFIARHYFLLMVGDYSGLVPVRGEHYGCMVDLLARAGRLVDAAELLVSMPFEPDAVAWTMLLAASTVQGDPKGAAAAAEEAFESDPRDTAPYVLLCNTFST